MQNASDLNDMAEAWELFLIYHHRTWSRCLAYYREKNYWSSLQPKYADRRATDPVLIYIHQARHADEHGLLPVTQIRAGYTTVSRGVLEGGSVIVGGGPSYLAPGSTAKVEITPTTVTAGSVINRGQTYVPPIIDGETPPQVLKVAEAALLFYTDLFREIDQAGGD
jgi:hypothetical protein